MLWIFKPLIHKWDFILYSCSSLNIHVLYLGLTNEKEKQIISASSSSLKKEEKKEKEKSKTIEGCLGYHFFEGHRAIKDENKLQGRKKERWHS